MPLERLSHFVLLPDLEMTAMAPVEKRYARIDAVKKSAFEVCPRCASASSVTYDHRTVTVKDAPIRDKCVRLVIRKRRLWCKPCRKPFTEPVAGIGKGRRYTQRYKAELMWCCNKFADLKSVREHLDCSYGFLYRGLYEMLRLDAKKRRYPWPAKIGIDEHAFKRNREMGFTEFVTFIVDQKNKRAFEVVDGRTDGELGAALAHIPGRENVRLVSMDLSDPYRRFVRRFFPNARIVADKFHVLRLLNPAINRRRIELTGDRRKLPIRRLLLKSWHRLDFRTRRAISDWLADRPELREVHAWKEALQNLYRVRGYDRARTALLRIIDGLSGSRLPEAQTLRRTLISWQREILAYFDTGLTNARVEGFNNRAKVIKRMAYGYRSFENYRLRLLNACS